MQVFLLECCKKGSFFVHNSKTTKPFSQSAVPNLFPQRDINICYRSNIYRVQMRQMVDILLLQNIWRLHVPRSFIVCRCVVRKSLKFKSITSEKFHRILFGKTCTRTLNGTQTSVGCVQLGAMINDKILKINILSRKSGKRSMKINEHEPVTTMSMTSSSLNGKRKMTRKKNTLTHKFMCRQRHTVSLYV